jgi:hypothetical protein
VEVAIGMPRTSARNWLGVTWSWPPWEQVTVAWEWRTSPGIGDHPGSTVRAPLPRSMPAGVTLMVGPAAVAPISTPPS